MIEFKKSPVVFDEDSHTYTLEGKQLLGITGLIHSILGLGVYSEADDYVKDFIIPRAGSRGTAIHHAIQTYDQLGIKQTTQFVRTKFGCRERDNICYEDLEWDVTEELDNYIRHLDGFEPLFNELTVSDNAKWASQIDNGWLKKDTLGIWLVDTKSNNIELYPLCGYFKQDYFRSGEEALKEYLSWQLSIYAVLFEDENPGYKVEGLACNWLRKSDGALWEIPRKPDHLVRELLKSEYIFTDNGPVYFHPDPSVFGIGKDLPVMQEEKALILPEDVVNYVASLVKTEKEVKAKLEEAKKGLRLAMETHGVKSFDFGSFKATISADSQRTSIDTARLKQERPEIYKQYVTTKISKGGLTLK